MTDEEIVKALECCTVDEITDCENCPLLRESCAIIRKYALDLINKQKAEIERLTEENEARKELLKIYIKEKVKLDEENGQLKGYNSGLEYNNDELQKQVDELKNAYNDLLETCRNCDTTQTVKATAKEIYTQMLEWIPIGEGYSTFIDNFEMWIKEHYGVNVE